MTTSCEIQRSYDCIYIERERNASIAVDALIFVYNHKMICVQHTFNIQVQCAFADVSHCLAFLCFSKAANIVLLLIFVLSWSCVFLCVFVNLLQLSNQLHGH